MYLSLEGKELSTTLSYEEEEFIFRHRPGRRIEIHKPAPEETMNKDMRPRTTNDNQQKQTRKDMTRGHLNLFTINNREKTLVVVILLIYIVSQST
jgi:hypothetical protein